MVNEPSVFGPLKFYCIYDTQVALCMSLVVMVRNRKHFYELIDWFVITQFSKEMIFPFIVPNFTLTDTA